MASKLKKIDVEVLPPETSLPAVLVDHTPEAILSQWRKAYAGLLEIVRFGAMLVEVDSCLKRQTAKQRNQHSEVSLKSWMETNCPDISYKTAMGYKVVAEQMRDKYKIPAKLPLTLALPQSDGTINVYVPDNINIEAKKVEQYQREFYGMCEGKSMYQLTLDLGIREAKPRGGARNLPKNLTAEESYKLQCDAADQLWARFGDDMIDQVRRIKSHLMLSSGRLEHVLIQLEAVRDALKIAKTQS